MRRLGGGVKQGVRQDIRVEAAILKEEADIMGMVSALITTA